jgi:hypothetical protein
MMSQSPQIFVDERREFRESGMISLAPSAQELANSFWRGRRHIH